MGADYFIIKQLRIEHSEGTSTIELDRQRCYFDYSNYDSDDSDDKYKHYLTVTFVPRVPYEYGN